MQTDDTTVILLIISMLLFYVSLNMGHYSYLATPEEKHSSTVTTLIVLGIGLLFLLAGIIRASIVDPVMIRLP